MMKKDSLMHCFADAAIYPRSANENKMMLHICFLAFSLFGVEAQGYYIRYEPMSQCYKFTYMVFLHAEEMNTHSENRAVPKVG
ncbi:hypothetical protein PAJ34TS1_36020 [Paenibacillus azoreducens]|uniref:Uncharacterized protein n=1 Tax=Paenibacillus azoreducens TaxID=116718 RepID=A0A919YJE3_9BACL|nr:hypothetical protein J34TS1_51700 [Paenibacillus azoreducens]